MRRLILPTTFALLLALASPAFASWTAARTERGSATASSIFPGARTTSAWTIADNSAGGGDTDRSAQLAAVDGVSYTTGNWGTDYSATRYVDLDLPKSLPNGLAVADGRLNLTLSSDSASRKVCFYVETRVQSADTLVPGGRHGSATSDVGCTSSPHDTFRSWEVSLPEIATTGQANDLRIRLFAFNSTNNRPARIDAAAVSGSFTGPTPFSLLPKGVSDRAGGGSAVTTAWALSAADASAYRSAAAWQSSFATPSPTRSIKVTVPALVPASATVTSVTLTHVYKNDSTSGQFCYVLDVLEGVTVRESLGSAAAPFCSTAGSGYTTAVHSLASVTTAARANSLALRLWGRSSNGARSLHDRVTVSFDYSVD